MPEYDSKPNVLERAGGVVWEQYVVTSGGQVQITAEMVQAVENSMEDMIEGDTEYYVESHDVAIDVFILNKEDVLNVVEAVDRRDRAAEAIGTRNYPKLSQHMVLTHEFMEKNHEFIARSLLQ